MADTKKNDPILGIQVESLVVMKMATHCSSNFPSVATGSLLGMDKNGVVEVTNCFPFPTIDAASDSHQNDATNLAASAPRAKSNIAHQAGMIRNLKEVNVDANNIGWYTSATMGNFINMNFVENQYMYQNENPKAITLVIDVARGAQGGLSLRAFQLTPLFMATFKEGKFATENLRINKLTYSEITTEFAVNIHSSHLVTSFLHELSGPSAISDVDMPVSVEDIERSAPPVPLYPSIGGLELSIDPFLEKTCDLLLDSVESHYTELNNHQYYQRQLAREQTKITAWQTKRKAENAQRTAAKQAPLPEDEWKRLFKLPQEPNRLEGMLNARQVDQYSKQVDNFTASITAKMFAVRGTLLYE